MERMAGPPSTRALTVGDIMSRSVLTTEVGASVAEAAALMFARRVGSVVVVEGNTPIGILTERDLVRFAAGAADARAALVGDHMTADPDTVEETEEVIDAFRRFAAHGYRHIPVVASGELVGIISMRDLVMKLRRGPAAAAHGAVGPTAAAEALPPVASDLTSTVLSLLEAGRATVPALVVPDGPELSYRSLRQHVARVADTLASLGVARGDRVAIVLANGPEAVVAILGAASAAAAAPLNPACTEDELRYYIEDVSARALIVPRGGGEAARRAWRTGGPLIEIAIEPGGKLSLETSPPIGKRRTATSPGPDDVALVLHSSGTTGRPKRAALRHRNLASSARNTQATYGLSSLDTALCVMPLFHIHGLVGCTLSTFAAAGTVVMPVRFNPVAFRRILGAQKPTWYTAVPTIHQLILARQRGAHAGSSLRFIRSASSKLHEATLLGLEEAFGVPCLEAYGMTEASHQIASNPLPPASRVSGSVGRGVGVRIGVMDAQGQLLTVGASGEVVIQGPSVIDGYDDNPEADARSFTNGWFRTGDQGFLDSAGYLTLVGRLKEMINRAGEKIAPHEIDEALLRHPAVAEAVSFGVPHDTWGEVVEAAVVLRGEATEAQLLRHCREQLADFKIPTRLHVVESIPKGSTGKIQRTRMPTLLRGAP
jgi:acyl-CoA synthetase (AMP-forming)/AMP-acid ligase II/CBS domain-containing protein